MARVSDSEMRDMVEARDGESVMGFINDAHDLIEDTLATFTPPISEARLKLLEKNLAAHFWVIAKEKGGLTLERTGDAQNIYRAPDTKATGLSSTRFGQQVLALDPSGLLNKVLTFAKKAQIQVIKKGPRPLTGYGTFYNGGCD